MLPGAILSLLCLPPQAVDGAFSAYRLSVNDAWLDQSWMFVGHHVLVIPLYMHPLLGIAHRCSAGAVRIIFWLDRRSADTEQEKSSLM